MADETGAGTYRLGAAGILKDREKAVSMCFSPDVPRCISAA